jgi:hypothetical protein
MSLIAHCGCVAAVFFALLTYDLQGSDPNAQTKYNSRVADLLDMVEKELGESARSARQAG